jgi:hypothetical protein
MKINQKKILIILNNIRYSLKRFLTFFEFIVEELPNIFSILIIPTSLGYFLLLPNATTWTSIVASILIEIYLIVKSSKKFSKSHNKWSWQIALIIASLFFGFLVILITLLTQANLEFGLKFQK